jgi:hypothetical protein
MLIPRKSIVGKTKKSTTKKKPTMSRARKGERLLVTCAPIVTDYMMDDLVQTLHGSFFTDPDGRYQQVVAVRIDERAHKIYGKCQEMYEAAPYMFAPI